MNDNALANAKWIWCHEDTDGFNQYALFRKAVELPDDYRRVIISACADMRYWLYFNGKRVGFGPGKFDPSKPYYNVHDVTNLAAPGLNVIAFKVHSIGPVERCSSFMPRRAGLIASAKWNGGEARTGADWKAYHETAYSPDTPRFQNHQSFIESFDARKALINWAAPDFDDSAWQKSFVLPPDKLNIWGDTDRSPVENLTLIPRSPSRIIETGRAVTPGDPDDMMELAGNLENATRRPSQDVQINPQYMFPLKFKAPQDSKTAAYAVFDFGENSAGYLNFKVSGTPGAVIDLGYGEEFKYGKVRCNMQTVRYADRFILGEEQLEHQLMFPKTLRYLLVQVRGGDAVFEHIGQDVSAHPIRWDGKFIAPEKPTLARVWQIGAHTVNLCMEDVYMDTPRRERAGWLGDMVPQAMAAYYAFGETKVARHSIDLFMQSQRPDGSVVGRFPSNDGPNFPTWTASFAFATADYVRHSGDVDFARAMWPGMRRITESFERQRLAKDLIRVIPSKRSESKTGGYVLVDWVPTKLDGAVSVMNMFYYRYLTESAWLADLLGEAEDAKKLTELAERTRRAIRSLLFDQVRGIFVNCRDKKGLSSRAGYQENMLALLWDIAAPEQQESIISNLLPDDSPLPIWRTAHRNWLTISNGIEPWDDSQIVPVGSPFFMYYALWALFEMGRDKAALNNIEAHYGGLLSEGETTVWEDFSGDTSRSHGWGAGPTSHLGKYVLGVEPTSPGFSTFSVLPSFAGLTHAEGRIPTPRGIIETDWRIENVSIMLNVTVPPGARCMAGLPLADGAEFSVNGVPVDAAQIIRLRRGVYMAVELTEGAHEIQQTSRI